MLPTLLALLACTPAPDAPTTTAAPTAPAAPAAPFYCFGWAHGMQSSTDCYRTEAACAEALAKMRDRAVPGCDPADQVSCTTITDSARERCFGTARQCGAYRDMIASRGLDSSACAEATGSRR